MKRVIFTALTLALAVSCASSGNQTNDNSSEDVVRVATKSATAEGKSVTVSESFTSEIKAYQENNITPAVSGVRIDKLFVEVGDKVQKGDVVATLDPTQYNQQMINLKNLQDDYERYLKVYEAGGIARQTLDQMKAGLDVQEEIANDIKKNISLRSPISGIVTARFTEEGNLFANQPIVNVAQIDTVKVYIEMSEIYFTTVNMNTSVVFESSIYPGEQFKGKVSLIYPTLDPDTRTFTVEVIVPNKSAKLRPGMHATAIFNLGTKDGVLVPDVAIQKQIGTAESFVYVIENGVAQRRTVVKGKGYGSQVDILSGVKPGDKVVTTAFSRISNGTALTIE